MSAAPTLITVSLAALGLGAGALRLAQVSIAKRNGSHANKAGERSTEEWEGRMRRMHEESEERLMADIRVLMISRNEELRRIIREEMGRKMR